MQNSSLIKWFAGLTALIFVVAALLNFWKPAAPVRPEAAPAPAKPHETVATYHSPAPRVARPAPEPELESNENGLPKLPREKVEAWLAKHNRNASSLLTAFRAMGDTNYLNEAATNFPGDPQVQLAVLSRDAFPEDRRKWLESFKASSPDNSLANYLSAADCFKSGKSAEAVQELQSASGKEQFNNYAMETMLDGEELFSDSGTDPRLTASYVMSGVAEEDQPQLASFKVVAQGIGEAMKNDPSSAKELAQIGFDFTGKINSDDSGKFIINQLVGTAIEKTILSQLDQNTAYDFLNGQTPAQVGEAYKQQKAELRKLMADLGPAQMQMMQSESETANYMQRMKIYGELAAMKWLIQQHPPADPAK